MAKRRRRSSYKTKVKRAFTKATGIPTTRRGRKAKIKRMITGGGCMLPVMSFVGLTVGLIILIS